MIFASSPFLSSATASVIHRCLWVNLLGYAKQRNVPHPGKKAIKKPLEDLYCPSECDNMLLTPQGAWGIVLNRDKLSIQCCCRQPLLILSLAYTCLSSLSKLSCHHVTLTSKRSTVYSLITPTSPSQSTTIALPHNLAAARGDLACQMKAASSTSCFCSSTCNG